MTDQEQLSPAQKFKLAAERIEIERKELREMATTVRMRAESSQSIMDELLSIVSEVFNIPESDIKSKSRKKEISMARHAYCYLCGKLDPFCTLKKIGMSLDRDHSTVLNSYAKCEAARATDYYFASAFDRCLKRVADSNKRFMQKIQHTPEQIEKGYSTKESELRKALAALGLLHEFMLCMGQHDRMLADGNPKTGLIQNMQKLKVRAIKLGF